MFKHMLAPLAQDYLRHVRTNSLCVVAYGRVYNPGHIAILVAWLANRYRER